MISAYRVLTRRRGLVGGGGGGGGNVSRICTTRAIAVAHNRRTGLSIRLTVSILVSSGHGPTSLCVPPSRVRIRNAIHRGGNFCRAVSLGRNYWPRACRGVIVS